MLIGNLLIHCTNEDFNSGIFEDTVLSKEDCKIKLENINGTYKIEGTYISKVIKTPDFHNLIFSWNAETPQNTKIKIYCRVLVEEVWSSWLSFGTWTTSDDRSSGLTDTTDEIAYVSTDTLIVNGNDKFATAFQYKLSLYSESSRTTPTVKLVAATMKNFLENNNILKIYDDNIFSDEISNYEGVLEVYPYSQLTKDPTIAKVMCSATSSAMVLKYHGIDITPEEVAWGVYDTQYDGFGNWPFNTAFISTFGLTSYIDYFHSIDDLKRELIKGNPILVSVRYKQPSIDKNLPTITNAAYPYTFGHIIVVKGFIRENGEEYVVVNDPAAENDSEVSLKYLAEEFDKAWSNKVAYVIHKDGKVKAKPERIKVKLIKTGKEKTTSEGLFKEFKIFMDNKEIDISNNNACSIMYKNSIDERFANYLPPETTSSIWINEDWFKDTLVNFRFVCKNCVTYDGDLKLI